MSDLRENRPSADILMLSMRAMGYSFESAVADIVDNSISADANRISLRFGIDPAEVYVAICDDGCGMNQSELFDAMKYGSEQKRDGRADNDLGRFGLGLKAASLSQCRKLTVASKKNGTISACIWDLDIVEEKQDWYMVECDEDQIKAIKSVIWLDAVEHGTVVVWENLICYNKVVTVVANEKNIRKEVGNMTQNYTPEFRKKIVRLYEEEGRTYKSITAEYGVSKASICKWCSELRKECQTSEQAKADYNSMKENLRLKRENEELRKENAFLKKAAAFFAKEIG